MSFPPHILLCYPTSLRMTEDHHRTYLAGSMGLWVIRISFAIYLCVVIGVTCTSQLSSTDSFRTQIPSQSCSRPHLDKSRCLARSHGVPTPTLAKAHTSNRDCRVLESLHAYTQNPEMVLFQRRYFGGPREGPTRGFCANADNHPNKSEAALV